jgi:hypothetical protein
VAHTLLNTPIINAYLITTTPITIVRSSTLSSVTGSSVSSGCNQATTPSAVGHRSSGIIVGTTARESAVTTILCILMTIHLWDNARNISTSSIVLV